MPLIHSRSEPAFKANVASLMHEAKAGTSRHVTKPSQALAVAYSIKRRGHAEGGEVSEDSIMSDFARRAAADAQRRSVVHPRAFGGFMPWGAKPGGSMMVKNEIRSMHKGPVLSAVGGRTDHHPTNVPSGSYVLPADHISSLGQGNTLNGMKQINHMFRPGHAAGISKGPGAPSPPKSPRMIASGGASDKGGARGHGIGQPTPVAIAGGEDVLTPEEILGWLQRMGLPVNLKFGHAALDKWVVQNRKKHIKTLKGLPGPAKS